MMTETIPEKLNKIRKSVLLCTDFNGTMCEQCPYYREKSDDEYICVDQRNKDFLFVFDWIASCVDMVRKFTGRSEE